MRRPVRTHRHRRRVGSSISSPQQQSTQRPPPPSSSTSCCCAPASWSSSPTTAATKTAPSLSPLGVISWGHNYYHSVLCSNRARFDHNRRKKKEITDCACNIYQKKSRTDEHGSRAGPVLTGYWYPKTNLSFRPTYTVKDSISKVKKEIYFDIK